MATMPATAPEPQERVNHLGRIIGVFVSPRKTFEDIARRPSWIAPVLLMTIIGTFAGVLINQKTNWSSFMRQKNEQSTRLAEMPEEKKEQVLRTQVKFAAVITYVMGALGSALFVLIFTVIFWGAFNLFCGAGLNFGTSFGIMSHAYLPSAFAGVLMLITLPLKAQGDVDPEHLLASNVGAFLGSDSPKWLQTLGSSLDIFWIWILVLIAIGFSAANPKKIKTSTAFGIVFGLWIVWVLCKVGWAAI
jgi:hypothetical protein